MHVMLQMRQAFCGINIYIYNFAVRYIKALFEGHTQISGLIHYLRLNY